MPKGDRVLIEVEILDDHDRNGFVLQAGGHAFRLSEQALLQAKVIQEVQAPVVSPAEIEVSADLPAGPGPEVDVGEEPA